MNSFLLAISSSIDSLGIGVTYGIKNTKLSKGAVLVLFCISIFVSLISIVLGNILKNIFSESLANFIGSFLLIFIGLFICIQTAKKCFILNDPIYYDFDKSNIIDYREAIFLGLALSIDCFSIGIGGSMIEFNFMLFPIFISVFQLLFFSIGTFLGKKLYCISSFSPNIWSFISGLLIALIGIFKLVI